jgi:hypothetical protein
MVNIKVGMKCSLFAVVGIVTWCRNGVTIKQLFFLFKTITSYKSNGSGLVKNAIGHYKQKLQRGVLLLLRAEERKGALFWRNFFSSRKTG